MITFSGAWHFKNKEHKQTALATARDAVSSQDGFFPSIASADAKNGFYLQTGTQVENKLRVPSPEIMGGGHHNVDVLTLDQSIKKDLADHDIIEGRDYKHYPKQHLYNLSMRLRDLFSFH